MDLRDVEEDSHHTLVPLVGRQVEGSQVSFGPKVRKEGPPVGDDRRLRLDGGWYVRQQLPNHLCREEGGSEIDNWTLLIHSFFVVYFGVITSLQHP